MEDTKAVAQTAIGFYKGRLAAATEPMQKVDAAARLTQIPRYFAGLLVRAEIPLDMRSGELALEKRDAFCDAMANAAEGLLGQATEAARACTTLGEALPASWWTPVCSVQ